jgi:hypothetical protein
MGNLSKTDNAEITGREIQMSVIGIALEVL